MNRFLPCIAPILCAFLLAGCGPPEGRKSVYPAKGRIVNAKGEPLAGAVVMMHPTDALTDHRHKPAGTADKDGNFVLSTYTENDGAPSGEYVATIEWKPVRKNLNEPEPTDRLGGKFRDPKASPFKITIAKKSNDLPPIQLP